MKILLCEDDHNIAVIAKLSLEQIGRHKILHVADGLSALNTAQKEKFDLILLDEMMPKMSGAEVCRAFTKISGFNTPVIFMSANPQQERVNEFASVAIGFIPKPFDPLQLAEQIQNIMDARKKAAS